MGWSEPGQTPQPLTPRQFGMNPPIYETQKYCHFLPHPHRLQPVGLQLPLLPRRFIDVRRRQQ